MKKPVITIEETPPKSLPRADLPPANGFVMVVDGRFKTAFETDDAAQESGRELKSKFPMLQVEIYDTTSKLRSPVRLL